MERCWNEKVGGTEDPRGNPPTSVRHDCHLGTSGVNRPVIEPGSPCVDHQIEFLSECVVESGGEAATRNIEVSRADEGEAKLVWSSARMQGRGKREIPEKTSGRCHRPARFPHAKIRERPRDESNTVCLGGRRVVWPLHHRGPLPCRNERAGETGDPRENPPASGIDRHDSHMRRSGSDLGVKRTPASMALVMA
ncbi:hypothetical protein PR048_007414 [Dryococelus australis]|uniref:Uncharacterized protein n=1 Tax=Dryococelus australis TaxID=614101 RepID=A0ABQ9HUG4_9NEOP|nr:hypothetical protein PR048_007414 [Dryococelus australis]